MPFVEHFPVTTTCAFLVSLLVLLHLRALVDWRARARGRPLPPGPNAAQQEQIAKNAAAITVEGGSDTTYSTIEGLFLALSLYPEVQRKAQAELDAVVGRERLPDFEDRHALEALRWHNVAPLGVTQCILEDDELNGYFIPAGTSVVPNAWAILHDPQRYPDPDIFNPDRVICDAKPNSDVLDPAIIAFGHGRRVCAGKHFADSTLFIVAACVLHVFDIGPPLDDAGLPVKIEYQQTHGFLSYVEDSQCTIKPRNAEAEALIRGALGDSAAESPVA